MDAIKDLLDAQDILARAYVATIGMGEGHEKVWRCVMYIREQSDPLIAAQLAEENCEVAP